MLDKAMLRREMLEKRDSLPVSQRQKIDAEIIQNVVRHPLYQKAQMVFCYVSMGAEIDTRPFIARMHKEGKQVCVPLCTAKGVMEARQIKNDKELAPGAMGILEPLPHCKLVPPKQIELAIVPCLACDRRGYRLGYGGGYYDRYLQRWDGVGIVLCRADFVLPQVPVNNTDVPLPYIATEEGIVVAEKAPCKTTEVMP